MSTVKAEFDWIHFKYLYYNFTFHLRKIAIKLSGLDWSSISPCSRWMEPFFRICTQAPKLCLLENNEQLETKFGLGHVCPNITTDESHIIQMHTTNMDMFVSIAHY